MMLVSAGSLKTVIFAGRMEIHPPRFSNFKPRFDTFGSLLISHRGINSTLLGTTPATDFTTATDRRPRAALAKKPETNKRHIFKKGG